MKMENLLEIKKNYAELLALVLQVYFLILKFQILLRCA